MKISKDSYRACLALGLTLAFSTQVILAPVYAPSAYAASSKKNSSGSSGTLLLPLTPKIDESDLTEDEKQLPSQVKSEGTARPAPETKQNAESKSVKSEPEAKAPASATLAPEEPKLDDLDTTELQEQTHKVNTETGSATTPRLEAEAEQDDINMADVDSSINDDTTLKGTIQIVADDTEYDQEKNTFLGTGNAIAIIGGQDSKLEADNILYDQNTQMIDARGNVKIIRAGQLTTGSSFKFNVTSDEYLITNPDTEVKGTQVVARKAFGTDEGMAFKNGQMTLPKPFHLGKNVMFGTLSAGQDIADRVNHPDVFLAGKPSYTFKARKMVYERYKDSGNLTVFGGKVSFGKFNIPLPKFVASVGSESRVRFPVTPLITSNIQSGGINIGPSFNTGVGKTGILNWAPMVQLGGRTTSGSSNSGSLGLSGQVGFTNNRVSAHIAYGSVSNLFVADFKAPISKSTTFQAGANRFMADGLYGYRRAHLIAEVVDNRFLGGIPYINGFNFRTSAGWAQDNPQLINLSPEYAKLFGGPTTKKTQPSAFRLQEQITFSTKPLFAVGNDKYGTKAFIYGGTGLSAYSSGDYRAMIQAGPTLDTRLNRLHFQVGYTQSAVRGGSPFVFDQFIQGQRSTYVSGDVKLSKWLTIGGGYGYNLNSKLAYTKTLSAVIGPDDFKVLITRDVIRGQNRVGFDLLYGAPIPFNKLVLKGTADHGNLGGL